MLLPWRVASATGSESEIHLGQKKSSHLKRSNQPAVYAAENRGLV